MKLTSTKFLASLALGLSLFFTAPRSRAETMYYPAAKIALEVPDDWKTEHKDEVLTAEAPNGQLHVIMKSIKGCENLKAALDEVDQALDESFTHAHNVGETEETEVHGLKATQVHGVATLEGHEIKWTAFVVENGHHFLLVVAFGTEEGLEKHAEEAKVIFQSIRPKSDD
jgi:hypothetical protein